MNGPDASAFSLLKQRAFVLLCGARVLSSGGYQMMALVIGWQVYALTGSAFDLGLIGLIQFVPAVLLTLLVGHSADRYDRRTIVRLAQSVYVVTAAGLTVAFLTSSLTRDILFAAVFLIGCARAFELPTASSLLPLLVPGREISRAVAAWAASNQAATIAGPALGGLLYVVSPTAVTALCIVVFGGAVAMVSLITVRNAPDRREPPTFRSALAGFAYIRQRERLLGVISLDLFVVLLGGATALLPVYARDILHSGPIGLGLLRSAPAVGALASMLWLSRRPIERHIGPKLFAVVSLFGLATVVFALSSSLPLSLAALAVLGASDAVSVVIRFSLVQIETPDDKRGRVSAVNALFTGTSNTLGEFESGTVAAWLGPVASVLIGGIGSLLIAGLWMVIFPALRRVDRFSPADEIAKGS